MSDPIIIKKLPPVWFIRTLKAFRSGLLWLHRRTFPASIVMYERFSSFWVLSAIRVAAELNISGILKNEPLSIQQLAERTGSNQEALFRIMRALVSEGIYQKSTALRIGSMDISDRSVIERSKRLDSAGWVDRYSYIRVP